MDQQNVSACYDAVLHKMGRDLTHADLLARYPTRGFGSENSAEPVLAQHCKFFEDFAVDPESANKLLDQRTQMARAEFGDDYADNFLSGNDQDPLHNRLRHFDFRLNELEMKKLTRDGFVVTQRMSTESFGEMYNRLCADEMPMFVTADSVLHAWHRTFDAMLADLEERYCMATIEAMLAATLVKVDTLFRAAQADPDQSLSYVLLDVDLFLAVAQSLLAGELQHNLQANKSRLEALWESIQTRSLATIQIFGSRRVIDCALFTARGHYLKSESLKKYFRALTWLGIIDFRVFGGQCAEHDMYHLQCALMFVHLLRETQQLEHLASMDTLLASLLGDGDAGSHAMMLMQLNELVPSRSCLSKVYFPHGVVNKDRFSALQQQIFQQVHTADLDSNQSPTSTPISMTLFRPRFIWTSFIFTRLVYDHIIFKQEKQPRRIPSVLDIAFTLFGNDAASEELARRMQAVECDGKDLAFVKFRDGIQYTPNLLALRETIDCSFDECDSKEKVIGRHWIEALRELSKPPANRATVFHSQAWRLRMMNTQLASYTQFRHDTALYPKQTTAHMSLRERGNDCYVDPYPEFWARLQDMAARAADLVGTLRDPLEKHPRFFGLLRPKPFPEVAAFLRQFAHTMKKLHKISVRQASHKDLSSKQQTFLKNMMEESRGHNNVPQCGWYPKLFYTGGEDSSERGVLIAEVNRNLPSTEHEDPGGVLHCGVGDVNFGVFAVNNVLYAGPVFSSYEFVRPLTQSWTDELFERSIDEVQPQNWALDSFLCGSKVKQDDCTC